MTNSRRAFWREWSIALGFAAAIACLLWAAASRADDEPPGVFFAKYGPNAAASRAGLSQDAPHTGGVIPAMIRAAALRSMAAPFAATLVRIAKIESGLRCAPGGNGGGLFQFSGGTRKRLGLSHAAAQSCSVNVAAAMRYASTCMALGARTDSQMMACWNSGSPFTRLSRLERPYRHVMGRG